MKSLLKDKTALAMLVIVAIVVVVVAVVGVGAYVLLTQNAGTPEENPTPTPTEGATSSPTDGTPDVAGASSLKYSVTVTEGGAEVGAYTFYGKNAGTDNFAMRIEYEDENGEGILIFNGATDEAWTYASGEWLDLSDYFEAQFDSWETMWTGYVDNLGDWTGTGDYTYGTTTDNMRIYDIEVNPALDDALFTHS